MIYGGSVRMKQHVAGWWLNNPKNMSSSIGIMKFPIYGKIMFQTANQVDNKKILAYQMVARNN